MKDRSTQPSIELKLPVWNPDDLRDTGATKEAYFQGFDCFYWVGSSSQGSSKYADFLEAFNSIDISKIVEFQEIGGNLEYVILAQGGGEEPVEATLFRIKSPESPSADETVIGICEIEPFKVRSFEGVSENIKRELDAEIELTTSRIIRDFFKAWIPSWFKKA